jgi:Ca2+-transporting ATPase
LPSSNVTTDAPATVADRSGPDLPTRHATAGSISARSPAEVFGALESFPQGLAAAKAASRLAAVGPNELRAAKRPPVIKKVLAQFTNLFALVLLADESRKAVVRRRRSRLPGQAPWLVRKKGV